MADVTLEKIGKSYGSNEVIRDLSITIRDGECFTFLGPSGCGKTVILRLIAGFEAPDTGEIRIGEKLVSAPSRKIHVPPEQRRIGVVFQDYAVWPHKTVYDNVIYPLQIQKVPKPEAHERAREIHVSAGRTAEAVRSAIEGPISAFCPASVLQIHPHTLYLLDEDAASLLTMRSYYQEAQANEEALRRAGRL